MIKELIMIDNGIEYKIGEEVIVNGVGVYDFDGYHLVRITEFNGDC